MKLARTQILHLAKTIWPDITINTRVIRFFRAYHKRKGKVFPALKFLVNSNPPVKFRANYDPISNILFFRACEPFAPKNLEDLP